MGPMPRFALLLLVACSHPTRSAAPTNKAPPESVEEVDAEEESQSECARYYALFARAEACSKLSDEDRQRLVQQDTDMAASRSESGMDGSSPYDTEAGCADGTAMLRRVAAATCGW